MLLPKGFKKKKNITKKLDVSLDFNLSAKQRQIYDWCEIGNGIQYVVVCTGRQVGKTLTDSVVSVDWSLSNEDYRVGFFLPTYKQCKKVFNGVKKMLTPLHSYIKFNQSDYTITFWNGSVIQFFTADNDNCRGFTFDAIIVDEACFVKNEIWEEAIEPTVAVSLSKKVNGLVGYAGKVLLTSTPKTKNWFYGMVNSEDERTVVTRFTSEEGGIIAAEVLARIKKRIPEAAYNNEYLGQFLDSGNGLFPYLECVLPVREWAHLKKVGHVAAVDVASMDDYTVLTIIDKAGNLVYIGRWRHQEYTAIMSAITKVLRLYGSPICYVETNGVGQSPFELLRGMYGRVESWNTSATSKTDIIVALQISFMTKELLIPDLEYLKDELDFFTCEWKNGKPSYSGSNGYHDDCVMSLAICNYHRKSVQLWEIQTFGSGTTANRIKPRYKKKSKNKETNY